METYVGGSWLSSSSSSSGGSSRSLYPVPSGACERGMPVLSWLDMVCLGIMLSLLVGRLENEAVIIRDLSRTLQSY
jgi:hypothetical protein